MAIMEEIEMLKSEKDQKIKSLLMKLLTDRLRRARKVERFGI